MTSTIVVTDEAVDLAARVLYSSALVAAPDPWERISPGGREMWLVRARLLLESFRRQGVVAKMIVEEP